MKIDDGRKKFEFSSKNSASYFRNSCKIIMKAKLKVSPPTSIKALECSSDIGNVHLKTKDVRTPTIKSRDDLRHHTSVPGDPYVKYDTFE